MEKQAKTMVAAGDPDREILEQMKKAIANAGGETAEVRAVAGLFLGDLLCSLPPKATAHP